MTDLEWFRAEVARLQACGVSYGQALSIAWQRVKRRMKDHDDMCTYHVDSPGWDECSDGYADCPVKR